MSKSTFSELCKLIKVFKQSDEYFFEKRVWLLGRTESFVPFQLASLAWHSFQICGSLEQQQSYAHGNCGKQQPNSDWRWQNSFINPKKAPLPDNYLSVWNQKKKISAIAFIWHESASSLRNAIPIFPNHLLKIISWKLFNIATALDGGTIFDRIKAG